MGMRWYGLVGLLLIAPASAAFSDNDAAAIAAASPAVAQSVKTIETTIAALPQDLRAPTQDGLLVTDTCIAYRKGETEATRRAVVDELGRQGLVTDAAAATRSLYGYPVKTDTSCVHTAAPFLATAGSEEDSHHSWPGGLADHIAFNLHAAHDMVARYSAVTGNHAYDRGTLDAAVLWHDWAKRLVLHWSDKGVVSYESTIGGTSSHHVIGLAEAMARRLPADEVLVQVCAHQAPSNDHDAKVTGWIRAAAIIARIDPVARGYLKSTPGGYALTVRPECRIHNLSDGNWVYAVPAAQHAKAIIARLAPQAGHAADDRRFLETALSYYGAERFDIATDAEALKFLQVLPKK
jgi:hypothetical protein